MPTPRSTLTSHAAKVAMAPSRALVTSHLRRLYETKYQGEHRHPSVTFILDLLFVAAAVVLVITAAWFATLPVPPPSGIRLIFSAPEMTAASPAAVQVRLQSADGGAYRDVRLDWHLPPGTQVVVANPRLATDHSLYLGELQPDHELASRAVVRVFQPQGGEIEFGFTVSYTDAQGKRRQFFGVERRIVMETALAAEVPAIFHTDGVVPEGALIPIRIENRSNETLPSVHVQLRETAYHAEEQIALGDMAPHEVRWVYIPLVKHETPDNSEVIQDGIARLAWFVGSASRNIVSGSWEARVTSLAMPAISGPLISRAGDSISVNVVNPPPGASIAMVHPFLDDPIQERAIMDPSVPVLFPAPHDPSGPNHEWFVTPILKVGDERILGPATMGVMSAVRFPFTTQVRYTSSAGDQLGAGPHPPQVGRETRYWVFWTVGPIDTPLQDILVETTLSPGVVATGHTSAPNDGSFSVSGQHVTWNLSRLGPVDNFLAGEGEGPSIEHGIPQALFGFEVSVTPSRADIGSILPLLATSTAQATDTHTPLLFQSEFSPLTSQLEEDGEQEGAGIVQGGTQ